MYLLLPATVLAATYRVNSNYDLSWTVNGDSITVSMAAATSGWVGFGLAEPQSGAMPGADILIGYVSNNGQTFIQDSHALQAGAPVPDACQDWTLVSGSQTGGWTNITATRKILSSDAQDRSFQIGGQLQLIAAYGPTDDLTTYHQTQRWIFTLDFADPSRPATNFGPDVLYFEFFNNHSIKPQVTEYVVNRFDFNFTRDYHIIAIEAIIKPETAKYVHHLVTWGMDAQTFYAIGIWTPNGRPTQYVPECGMRMGPGGVTYVWTNTHYDNPSLEVGAVDTSGVRVYYTPNFRPNDCGVIQFGDPNVELLGVGLPSSISKWEFHCSSAATTAALSGPINVFGTLLHMHRNGVQMWTSLNDQVVNRVDFWNFGLEPLTPVNVIIKPGDTVKTTCIYKTDSPNIIFGLGSQDEMCIDFHFYWPRRNGGSTWACGHKQGGGALIANSTRPSLDPRGFGATTTCRPSTTTTTTATPTTATPTKPTNAAPLQLPSLFLMVVAGLVHVLLLV